MAASGSTVIGSRRAWVSAAGGCSGSGKQLSKSARQMRREQQEEDEKTAAAKTRRDKSEAGQPVRGRIPADPHRLAEAQAHLAREIAMHQAKLDRRAALIAAGRKPMGDGRAWRAGARRAAAPCFRTSPVRVCAYHGVEAGRGHRPLAETRDAEAMSVATDL